MPTTLPARHIVAVVAALVTTFSLLAAGPARADSVTIHVVNDRAIAQFGVSVQDPDSPSGSQGSTDASGNVTLGGVSAGDRIDSSRLGPPPCGGSASGTPEGFPGVEVHLDTPVPATQTVTLPHTTGDVFNPTNDDDERWLVGQVNQLRQQNGRQPLSISTTLNNAASAVAHDLVGIPEPFPPPYCFVVPIDWGFPDVSGSAMLDGPFVSPEGAFAHWNDGSPRTAALLTSYYNAIGIGRAIVNGSPQNIAILDQCGTPAPPSCGMTADQGDPNLPHTPPPAGGGGPGGGGSSGGGAPGGTGALPGTAGSGGIGGGSTLTTGPLAAAIGGVAVAKTQKGTAVSGSVTIGRSGSFLIAEVYAEAAALARKKRPPVRLGRQARGNLKAGRTTFKVPINNAARKALRRHHKLKVTLKLTVRPPKGAALVTLSRTVTLKR